jgi:antitoxin component YwqK of YwqJK toxin-antitoxin module
LFVRGLNAGEQYLAMYHCHRAVSNHDANAALKFDILSEGTIFAHRATEFCNRTFFFKTMKPYRTLLIMIFCALTMVAMSQPTPKPGTVLPVGERGKDYNLLTASKKKDGIWYKFHQGGKVLYYKGQFKSGVPYGKFEFYYDNGSLMSIVDHVKDTTVNVVTSYHPDGKTLMSEGEFDGVMKGKKWVREKEGLWKFWDGAGVLRAEEHYTDSLLNGVCKYFYANGKILKIENYKMGVRNGTFTEYFESGKKRVEGIYLTDELDGPYKSWHETGMIEKEGKYIKGVCDGAWYFSNRDGLPEVSILYSKGKETKRKYENGTFKDYYDDNIPKNEYTYENGMLNGPFTEWYDKGQFVLVELSEQDKDNMILQKQQLQGTQVKMQGDYLDGKLEGEVTYYKENGLVEKTEIWSAGNLVSTKNGR